MDCGLDAAQEMYFTKTNRAAENTAAELYTSTYPMIIK